MAMFCGKPVRRFHTYVCFITDKEGDVIFQTWKKTKLSMAAFLSAVVPDDIERRAYKIDVFEL